MDLTTAIAFGIPLTGVVVYVSRLQTTRGCKQEHDTIEQRMQGLEQRKAERNELNDAVNRFEARMATMETNLLTAIKNGGKR